MWLFFVDAPNVVSDLNWASVKTNSVCVFLSLSPSSGFLVSPCIVLYLFFIWIVVSKSQQQHDRFFLRLRGNDIVTCEEKELGVAEIGTMKGQRLQQNKFQDYIYPFNIQYCLSPFTNSISLPSLIPTDEVYSGRNSYYQFILSFKLLWLIFSFSSLAS